MRTLILGLVVWQWFPLVFAGEPSFVTRRYSIPGFPAGPCDDEQNAVDLIAMAIEPTTWSNVGGDAHIDSAGNGRIVVTHSPEVHALVDKLFKTLRNIIVSGKKRRSPTQPQNDSHFVIGACGGEGDGEQPLVLVVYDVSDIVSFDPNGNLEQSTAELCRRFKPSSWVTVGGAASIQPVPVARCLVITQTNEVHAEIQNYLKQIRDARKP